MEKVVCKQQSALNLVCGVIFITKNTHNAFYFETTYLGEISKKLLLVKSSPKCHHFFIFRKIKLAFKSSPIGEK